jgi:hypothetical protein
MNGGNAALRRILAADPATTAASSTRLAGQRSRITMAIMLRKPTAEMAKPAHQIAPSRQ